jgi:hypothetical protein
MAFNAEKFISAQLFDRTEELQIKELSPFFDEGEKPVFVLRGLTGSEFGRVNEAHEKSKNIDALVSALTGSDRKAKAEAIKASLGVSGDDVPPDIVRRQEIIAAGVVSPEIDHAFAVKLSENFPTAFFLISNKILSLSGQGRTLGKPNGSGKTKK